MEVAYYPGLEVDHNHDVGKEAINNGQHFKSYPGAGTDVDKTVHSKPRICGVSRGIFWLAVAMAVLATIVIGLGIGLALTLSKVQNGNAYTGGPPDSSALSSSLQTVWTPALTFTSTSSTSTPSTSIPSTRSTRTIPQPSNICPGANNSIITRPLGKVRYRVACDSDFGPNDKETLASFFAATWNDCLDLCNTMNYFQNRGDVGCTWNVAGTGTQTPGTCWCLGGADKKVVENLGNVVAVPYED